jgi:hypothetical protein
MITALGSAGLLLPKLIGKDAKDLTEDEANALVDRMIGDGLRWARYYERKLEGARPLSKERGSFGESTIRVAKRLDEFVGEFHAGFSDPFAPPEHPLSRASRERALQDASALAECLRNIGQACEAPAPGILGRPSDGWLLGFIWGIAVGWRDLTPAVISREDGYFVRFLELAYAPVALRDNAEQIAQAQTALEVLEAGCGALPQKHGSQRTDGRHPGDKENEREAVLNLRAKLQRLKTESQDIPMPNWGQLVETAIKRFSLDSDHWRRPGDDLAEFPLARSLPQKPPSKS